MGQLHSSREAQLGPLVKLHDWQLHERPRQLHEQQRRDEQRRQMPARRSQLRRAPEGLGQVVRQHRRRLHRRRLHRRRLHRRRLHRRQQWRRLHRRLHRRQRQRRHHQVRQRRRRLLQRQRLHWRQRHLQHHQVRQRQQQQRPTRALPNNWQQTLAAARPSYSGTSEFYSYLVVSGWRGPQAGLDYDVVEDSAAMHQTRPSVIFRNV